MGVCNCFMFCCMLLNIHSSIAIILLGKRELIALLNLSSWCLVMVERLFLAVPSGCLRFVIVVFPNHTHLLFLVVVAIILGHFLLLIVAIVLEHFLLADVFTETILFSYFMTGFIQRCNYLLFDSHFDKYSCLPLP